MLIDGKWSSVWALAPLSICRPPSLLHAVSVDVTRAFDNVDIPLLLSLVEPLLRNDAYIVLKYQEVGQH